MPYIQGFALSRTGKNSFKLEQALPGIGTIETWERNKSCRKLERKDSSSAQLFCKSLPAMEQDLPICGSSTACNRIPDPGGRKSEIRRKSCRKMEQERFKIGMKSDWNKWRAALIWNKDLPEIGTKRGRDFQRKASAEAPESKERNEECRLRITCFRNKDLPQNGRFCQRTARSWNEALPVIGITPEQPSLWYSCRTRINEHQWKERDSNRSIKKICLNMEQRCAWIRNGREKLKI